MPKPGRLPKPDPLTPDDIFDVSDVPKSRRSLNLHRGGGMPRGAKELGLDLAAAERGQHWKVLPREHYYEWDTYPLPANKHDLFRLAVCAAKNRQNSPGRKYLHRCKQAYELYIKHRGAIDLSARASQAHEEVKAMKKQRRESAKALEEFKDELKQKVQVAQASLTELYDLAGKGFKKIMTAFVEGALDGNGDPVVSNNEFTNAAKTCFQQVARLGTPASDDAKKEATDLVFREAVKEMGEKIRLTTEPSAVKGTDTEQ